MNKKRLIITSSISIILVAILLIGSTYSVFTSSQIDENTNVYTTGNLDVTYTLSNSNISFTKIEPLTEEEADSITPYRITVTNSGTVPYKFDVILNETTASNAVDSKYIMTKVGYSKSKRLSDCANNIIKEDIILNAKESIEVDVRIWLSNDIQNSEIGKSFYAKLEIDGEAIVNDNIDIDNSILSLKYMEAITENIYFKEDTYREYIKTAHFVDYINIDNAVINNTTNQKITWDISEKKDNSIIAWLEENETTGYYNLYIGSEYAIYTKNLQQFFSGMTALENITFDNLDTSLTTSMQQMFYNCNKLLKLDLSNFDTINVTNMEEMFQDCLSLTNINLNNFKTSNVTNMAGMFFDCQTLKELNLTQFNTSKVTDMQNMFLNCSALEKLDLKNFNTNKVTNMSQMFTGCVSLLELDLSNFDTTNVTSMEGMFGGCLSLKSIDLSSFDTSKVTNMNNMFHNCETLTELDLSNFNTIAVTNMANMFQYCSATHIDLSSFDTRNVTNMENIFLESAVISTNNAYFDLTSATNLNAAFQNAKNIQITIIIKQTNASYNNIFNKAATSTDSKITVNYTSDTSDLVDTIIETKEEDSNIIKGIIE